MEVLGKSSLFAYGRAAMLHAHGLRIAFTRVLAAWIVGVADLFGSHPCDTLNKQ